MNNKQIKLIFGTLAFAISTIVYLMTVQDSVPFWDCSEFSGAAIWQQVPHPPGAPLFLMIGKMFDVLIPFGDPGWKINLVSVFSSSITILLLYLITNYVFKNINKGEPSTIGQAIAVYGSSFVGALAFTFSDTFWFNAVESEVYAMATLFVALVVYLMMLWNDKADEPDSEKYLMLIAYIIGLSTGVHLLAILAIFSIVFVVYFRKYEFSLKSFLIAGAVALVIFGIIYPGVVKYLPALLAGHSPTRNEAREYGIENSTGLTVIAILLILGAVGGFIWSYKKNRKTLSLIFSSFLLVLLGYTTYTQILIRSNSNPPMNENEPKTFTSLASYLGREQYGSLPSWPRRAQNEDRFIQDYTRKNPDGSYYYGPWNPPGTKRVTKKDGRSYGAEDWGSITPFTNSEVFWGEINYLFKYQIDHMFIRYLVWNFSGKSSDIQDSPGVYGVASSEIVKRDNFGNGYSDLFPINFFMIPLLFGLGGLFYHYQSDKKMAFAYILMFLMMGVLAAIAQQQQNPQPRERDYFYTGAFMIFSMWIGLGVHFIFKLLGDKKQSAVVSLVIIGIALTIIPFNMAYGGWRIHDRSGNYAPFDYAYNILQSAEKDAIIFTNGDNDTFPVWYVQDVMGVRRDVRIVNLSLGNTLWYVDQLKNRTPWGAKKIPLTFSDESLKVKDENDPKALSYELSNLRTVKFPVSSDLLKKYTTDSAIIANGEFNAQISGRSYGDDTYLYRVQDKVIMEILQQVKFTRPIYFCTSVGPDAFVGLERYFRNEGMLYRVCPAPQNNNANGNKVDIDIMLKCLMNVDNSDNFSTTPKYGFKLRNFNNMDVYYDEVHRRLTLTYRELYMSLAKEIIKERDDKKLAIKVLNKMNELISPKQFPMPYYTSYEISEIYKNLGDKKQQDKFVNYALVTLNEIINNDFIESRYKAMEATQMILGPYRLTTKIYRENKRYKEAEEVTKKFMNYVDSYIKSGAEPTMRAALDASILDAQITISEIGVDELIDKKDYQGALDLIYATINKSNEYNSEEFIRYVASCFEDKFKLLNKKLGIVVPEDTTKLTNNQ